MIKVLSDDKLQDNHLIANDDIFIFINFQVNYMLYWQFYFGSEILVNHLFTKWKWTYILNFELWSWDAFNVDLVDKVTFRNAREGSLKSSGLDNVFGPGS